MQPEELREGKLANTSEESSRDEKGGHILDKVTLAKTFLWKELLEIFHNIDITKDKIWEDDMYLERSMKIYQDIENRLICTVYEKKELSTTKLFLVSVFFFYKRIKHMNVSKF